MDLLFLSRLQFGLTGHRGCLLDRSAMCRLPAAQAEMALNGRFLIRRTATPDPLLPTESVERGWLLSELNRHPLSRAGRQIPGRSSPSRNGKRGLV